VRTGPKSDPGERCLPDGTLSNGHVGPGGDEDEQGPLGLGEEAPGRRERTWKASGKVTGRDGERDRGGRLRPLGHAKGRGCRLVR